MKILGFNLKRFIGLLIMSFVWTIAVTCAGSIVILMVMSIPVMVAELGSLFKLLFLVFGILAGTVASIALVIKANDWSQIEE
jgi:hypothetical protein